MIRAWLLLALAGCSLSVDYKGTTFECGEGGTCPDNLVCSSENLCVPITMPAPACSDMVAAGDAHGCSLRPDGTVWCWGQNNHGQLGNGTATDSNDPVQVMNLSGATAIAVGDAFSCAVVGGAVKCWGRNMYGELGDGSTSDARMPVDVRNVSGVDKLYASDDHACVILMGGAVTCWGQNNAGQLGDGTTADHLTPAPVPGITAAKLALGADHTCAIDPAGVLKCWGANGSGELGNGNIVPQYNPVMIATDVRTVGAGDAHICYVKNNGALYCAGHADAGQLGNGLAPDVTNGFFQVDMPANLVDLSLSDHRTCGLDDQKNVWCWGNGEEGRIGDGEWTTRWYPTQTLFKNVEQLASGLTFTCVRETGGSVRCMGSNDYGQLGNGMRTTRGAPQVVAMATDIKAIEAGGGYSCGITSADDVVCWGDGDSGQLADGGVYDRAAVGPTMNLAGTVQLSLSGDFGCARDGAGTVRCWGSNNQGQLGLGNLFQSAIPRVVTLPGPATDIATGDLVGCALVGGVVYCWGDNNQGQVGNGTTNDNVQSPAQVSNLTGATDIACGEEACCAITGTGTVQCWGNNSSGNLGNNNQPTDSNIPVDVLNLTGVAKLSGRAGRVFAVLGDGTAQGWGYACDGRLGSMPANCGANPQPVVVAGLGSVDKLSAGWNASCARKTDGTVTCWGPGWNGQIGDGQYTTRYTQTPMGITGALDVAAGGDHACAVMADKTVQCWGQNDVGQLGDGSRWADKPAGVRLTCQ